MPTSDEQRRIGSFTAAFHDLFPRAVRLARRMLGDRAAAEDVAAEAMARAYSSWARIDVSDSYRTGWVLRVTTNLAIDVVRRRANREVPADISDVSMIASVRPAPAGSVDLHESVAVRLVLVDALRTLPRRQQEVVVLRHLAGMSQAEVATMLGISTGTVATHVHRGLRGLRAQLGDLVPERSNLTEIVSDIRNIVRGGPMKVSSLQEAIALQGTETVLEAHVTGFMPGEWGWTVDVGVPAVMVMRGRRCEPDDDVAALVGQDVECVVVEVDLARDRMVVARAVPADEIEEDKRRHQRVSSLRHGDVLPGRVNALVPFGAFVDIGGVRGLVHVSELGRHVEHPQEVLRVGQEIEVEVLDTNPELQRVSLRLHASAA
ncbi:MAG TPA: sigma-70 family RNA polymerase sigma factor [Actinopolymorphaceae bacterium]|nr:sigma-70 family RNA polymerase sigma factor [Actinopolymorphaceae bacterium]